MLQHYDITIVNMMSLLHIKVCCWQTTICEDLDLHVIICFGKYYLLTIKIWPNNRLATPPPPKKLLWSWHPISGKVWISHCLVYSFGCFCHLNWVFFTISVQHKNGNIANFVLTKSFKIKKTNKICNIERYCLLPTDIYLISLLLAS